MVECMLDATKTKRDLTDLADRKYPTAYQGELHAGLEIEWLDKGTEFLIHEYDGSESIWTTKDLTLIA